MEVSRHSPTDTALAATSARPQLRATTHLERLTWSLSKASQTAAISDITALQPGKQSLRPQPIFLTFFNARRWQDHAQRNVKPVLAGMWWRFRSWGCAMAN